MALPTTYREFREEWLADLTRWDSRDACNRARNTQDKAGWDTVLAFYMDGNVEHEGIRYMRIVFHGASSTTHESNV